MQHPDPQLIVMFNIRLMFLRALGPLWPIQCKRRGDRVRQWIYFLQPIYKSRTADEKDS